MWAVTGLQEMLSSTCSDIVNHCDEINMYVVHVVSCVGISLSPVLDIVLAPVLLLLVLMKTA
jgi:hypothetical protein